MDSGAVGEVVYVAGEMAQVEPDAMSLGAAPHSWDQVKRNLLDDLHNTEWGANWRNAAVIAMSLGANGAAFFDAIAAERTPGWVALHINASGDQVGQYKPVADAGHDDAQSYQLNTGAQYLAFDLGSSQLVSRVDALFADNGSEAYEIQASNDPDFSEYTTGAVSGTGVKQESNGWRAHNFAAPINARYVRLAFAAPYKGATTSDLQLRAFTR